ncbi:MAG: hypothetical protein J2P23_08765 [Microlunatus sp.]|nr:hypothetical protein [Microlunatus sp.]
MSLNTDVPSRHQIERLLAVESPSAVSIYAPSTPIGAQVGASRLEFKNLVKEARTQLEQSGAPSDQVDAITEELDDIVDDDEFWREQSRSVAVFATPEQCLTYRLPNRLPSEVEVGDRLYVKPLLRAISFPQAGYVLALAAGSVRLIEFVADGPSTQVKVPDLPERAASAAGKSSLSDRAPIRRIQGSEGQKLRLLQYARKIDQALRPLLAGLDLPVVLAAAEPIASIYRQVNSYPHLLATGVPGNPEEVQDENLVASARSIVDDHYRRDVQEINGRIADLENSGRSSVDLATLAYAATQGSVETLLVDFEQRMPGTVGDDGRIEFAAADDHHSYGVVDEVARRVLRTGGQVLAVRADEIAGGQPAAGILRHPILAGDVG